jgi:choline kinase
MNTFKFRTNILDIGEAEKLKPHFSKSNGIVEWRMNPDDPKRILIVKVNNLKKKDVSDIIFNAGFRSELVEPFWKKLLNKIFIRDCCK